MKLTRTLALLIAGDNDTQKLFDMGAGLGRVETAPAVVAETVNGQIKIPANTTVPIPLGGVTVAHAVLVAADANLLVRLNGGAEDIALKKATTGRAVFYLEGTVTALEVENETSQEATVLYALAGV